MLAWVPAAWAAVPSNDKFADAENLSSVILPIQVSRTNVEATEEEVGEPFVLFTAGHSVWFKWEATGDEVVTIDTCNSEFSTSLVVFTGSLGALTKVGEDNNSDGRFCPDAAGVTFRTVAGTTYSIMVDGNGFHLPKARPAYAGVVRTEDRENPVTPERRFREPRRAQRPAGWGFLFSLCRRLQLERHQAGRRAGPWRRSGWGSI